MKSNLKNISTLNGKEDIFNENNSSVEKNVSTNIFPQPFIIYCICSLNQINLKDSTEMYA